MTPPGTASVPPFDSAVVARLRNEAGQGAEDFFPLYVRYLCEDLRKAGDDLEFAANERNTPQMAEVGHRLRGAVGNFGARPLIELCLELERLAKDDRVAAALELVPAVQSELRRVETAALTLITA